MDTQSVSLSSVSRSRDLQRSSELRAEKIKEADASNPYPHKLRGIENTPYGSGFNPMCPRGGCEL